MIVIEAISVTRLRGPDAAAVLLWELMKKAATQDPENLAETFSHLEQFGAMLDAAFDLMESSAAMFEYIEPMFTKIAENKGAPPGAHSFMRAMRGLIKDLRKAVPKDGDDE